MKHCDTSRNNKMSFWHQTVDWLHKVLLNELQQKQGFKTCQQAFRHSAVLTQLRSFLKVAKAHVKTYEDLCRHIGTALLIFFTACQSPEWISAVER